MSLWVIPAPFVSLAGHALNPTRDNQAIPCGPAQGAGGRLKILLVLALELSNEVVDQALVEVLSAQVGVTGSGLDLKDSLLNGQQGHIEGATTQVKDENVALSGGPKTN